MKANDKSAARRPRRRAIEIPAPLDKPKLAILDAAEALFAEQGFAAVSLRDIADAGESQQRRRELSLRHQGALVRGALRAARCASQCRAPCRCSPAARRRGKNGSPSIHDIVDAFVRPPLQLGDKATHGRRGLVMMRFLSRMLAMPREHLFLDAYYGDVRSGFIGALSEVMPAATEETVLWRYHLMVGALIYALAGPQRMLRPTRCAARRGMQHWDVDDAVRQVVRFCEAGLLGRRPDCYRPRASAEGRLPRALDHPDLRP